MDEALLLAERRYHAESSIANLTALIFHRRKAGILTDDLNFGYKVYHEQPRKLLLNLRQLNMIIDYNIGGSGAGKILIDYDLVYYPFEESSIIIWPMFKDQEEVFEALLDKLNLTWEYIRLEPKKMGRGVQRNPDSIPMGECYKFAYQEVKNNSGLLVHGILIHPWDGKKFSHAWVERDGLVYDDQFTQKGVLPSNIKKFYSVWNPENIQKYNQTDAAIMVIKQRHYGPWH